MRREQSAGVIIVRKDVDDDKVLLMKSYDFWDFPKGGIEKDENKLQAAIREVKEETGITQLDFNWGKIYYETEPFGKHNKVVYYFVAETTTEDVVMGINPELGRPEHEEYAWVSFDQARGMVVERIKKAIDWAKERLDYSYGIKNERKNHIN
jgi:8-oxo-dGTP pyrophosphatase MutT (NUDIX family)